MTWFDDFERMRREMERLMRNMSPTLELVRQLERSYDFSRFGSDLIRAADIAREAAEPLRRLSEANYLRAFSDQLAKQHVDISRLLTDVGKNYRSPLADVAISIRSVAALGGPFPVNQWYEELVASAEVLEREEGLEPSEARARLERPLLEALGSLKSSPATAQFIISTLLALFLFWLSSQSSADSEARILARLDELETELAEAIELLNPDAGGDYAGSPHVVRRAATVLSRPSGRQGRALGLIYPGQLVSVIERRGKWVKIEWTDVSSRSVQTGWVLKKYVGRVK